MADSAPIQVSKHAKRRLKERAGIKPSRQAQEAERAWDSGLQHGQLKGRLHKWVSGQMRRGNASQARIHLGVLWLYSRNRIVITVLPVRGNLRKLVETSKE